MDQELFPSPAGTSWSIPQLQAAVRSWWLAEYSGFYVDDPPEAAIPSNTDLDEGLQRFLRSYGPNLLTSYRGPSKVEAILGGPQGWCL